VALAAAGFSASPAAAEEDGTEVAMAVADRYGGVGRRRAEAGLVDALALGLAQALALVPGVSRNGATLAAARARRFRRLDAHLLSWAIALPVMFGASALTAVRLARSRAAAANVLALLVGGGAAFCSTLASARLLVRSELLSRPLLPFALYRWLLALLVLHRLRVRTTTRASLIR
jgi:undecaprenyl-diphosphatase